ncbi:MAG: glycosyltransferase family 9 protein [Verrucomicrobiota bacterium]
MEKSDRGRGDLWHQARVLLRLWGTTFDYVFELGDGHRARLFAMLTRTRRLYSVKPSSPLRGMAARRFTVATFDWQTLPPHREGFRSVSEFLPLPEPIPPMLFDAGRAQPWPAAESLGGFAVVQVGTRQGFNRWNRDGWLHVGRGLLGRFPNLVITCGPAAQEREEAAWLQRQLGNCTLSTDGATTWPQMAWLLRRAQLYVGPNTAAMHLAAACGCPVVALFGPSIEDHWHPWRVPYRIVTTPGYKPLPDPAQRYARVKQRTMEEIQPRQVLAACEELLNEVCFL